MREAWILVALTVALPTPAMAEIMGADSLDWATADSDVVVLGVVSNVAPKQSGTTAIWTEVTLKVVESLRGPKLATLRFVEPHLAEQANRWRAEQTQLVVFLKESRHRTSFDKNYALAPYALREGITSLIDLAAKPRAFTSSFAVLEKPEEILAGIRAASRSTVTRSRHLDVPFGTAAFRALYAGSSVYLNVPDEPDAGTAPKR